MKRTFAALAAAATITAAAVPSVEAMQQELNQLTGAVFNGLTAMTLPTDNIPNLTLSQINRISLIIHGGDTESEKRQKIMAILNENK